MSNDVSNNHERTSSVTGAAIIGLVLAAAVLAWYVGGSMPQRNLFPGLLTITAVVLALAAPYRFVRSALQVISNKLDSEDPR